MDNAYNNDTCLKALSLLYPIDVSDARLRCLGYIINLVVKYLLYSKGGAKL